MTTATKTHIEAKWNLSKVQEEVSGAMVRNYYASLKTFDKLGPDALAMFEENIAEMRLSYIKQFNPKTPLELVKLLGEFEANCFGSKLFIQGDDQKATMQYETCGCYNAMQKMGKMDKQMEEKMGTHFQHVNQKVAAAFGFKVDVKMGDPLCTITYTK